MGGGGNDRGGPLFPVWMRVRRRTRCGFISRYGELVIGPEFEDGGLDSEGRLAVQANGRWGFIDNHGHMRVAPRFYEVSPFQGGAARCRPEHDEPVVFIGLNGELLFRTPDCGRSDQGDFSEGLVAISDGGRWGYMDRSGAWVIQPQFESAGQFAGGLAPVATCPGAGAYVDLSGSLHFVGRYLFCATFTEGLAAVEFERNLWGYIDRSGRVIVPGQFSRALPFRSGRALVMNTSGDWCYADHGGAVAIQSVFVNAHEFSEGLAAVTYHYAGEFGYIDTDGRLVIQPQFGSVSQFRHGLADVTSTARLGIRGYIDQSGQFVWKGRDIPIPDNPEILMPDEVDDEPVAT